MQFEADISKFFAIFNGLVVLTDCSDAEVLRSGDSEPTDDTKLIALPLAVAHRVTATTCECHT